MDKNQFCIIPAAEYHAAARSGQYMSSHMLATFRESPALYKKKITDEMADTESPALALGRAAHCLILEGSAAFAENYLVSDGPINSKTGEPFGRATKTYADWLSMQTREIVSGRDYGFLLKLRQSVTLHQEASRLLDQGRTELTLRANHCGVPCQVRPDCLSAKHGLVDLKTCDSLKWFEADARRYGYLFQMAFYRAVIREATGDTLPVHFVAVEKNEPFAAGVWQVSDDALAEAERINEAALRRYCECRESDVWSTGYESIRLINSL